MTGDQNPHDGDDDAVHGPQPLPAVDPAPMHAAVDRLTAALHAYVDTATGVRAEFGSAEADEDPRVLALESEVACLNAALYDLLHSHLGMHPELTGMVWRESDDEPEAPAEHHDTDEYHVGFVVEVPRTLGDQSPQAALGIVDNGGAQIVERLMDAGYTVHEWGSARGAPVGFDDEDGPE